MRFLLLVHAAARVLLLLLLRRRLLLLFTFSHFSYWYDNSRASYYCRNYLLFNMQSPAPASSLAEPPPAASQQLGRWICQQGLRSARIRGLLLVLAAASAAAAASTTTLSFLAFLRLITFRAGIAVILLLLLRLQPARDSRHTAVCLGTSSWGYCLVIVLPAVMTYDRSIGTRQAGSGKFCIIIYRSAGRTDPRGACTKSLSCKFL